MPAPIEAEREPVEIAVEMLGADLVTGAAALNFIHQLVSQDPFTGLGPASGVDFFPEPAALPAADRRDAVLLGALREALDDLASNRYAAAFANVAGGSSGDAESLLYASQLPKWLTVDHHRVPMNRREVPSAPRKPETAKPPGAGGAAGSGTSPLLAFRTP